MLASTLPNLLLSPMLPRASPPNASMPPREGPTPVGKVHRHDKVICLYVMFGGRNILLMWRDGEGGRGRRACVCVRACARAFLFVILCERGRGERRDGVMGGMGESEYMRSECSDRICTEEK